MAKGKVHKEQKREERKTRRRYARQSASAAAWQRSAAAEFDLWSLVVHRPPSTMPALCYAVAFLHALHRVRNTAASSCKMHLKQHMKIPHRHCGHCSDSMHTYNHCTGHFPDALQPKDKCIINGLRMTISGILVLNIYSMFKH